MEQEQDNAGNSNRTNAEKRIKESQIFVLTRQLRETMIRYNQETTAHRERCKRVIVRELELCK